MDNEAVEKIRERVISLIESEFESDAAFERTMSLSEKTVNNWRRGRSSSFMRMLPRLSEIFGVNVSELMSIPLGRDSSELSGDEIHLLRLYRKARGLPKELHRALSDTLENTINLYISTVSELKLKQSGRKNVRSKDKS